MTTATVKNVITRFITGKSPGVIVLKGAWGTGKTFLWNEVVKSNKSQLKLTRYCYISLFGLSSISEIRTAIFSKTIPTKLIGQPFSADSLNESWGAFTSSWIRNLSTKFVAGGQVPYFKNLSIGLDMLVPFFTRDTIICFDDFERIDDSKVKPEELLGLISELKEERNCLVGLIFNDEQLGTRAEAYRRYKEKVIDIEVRVAPTSAEAAALVFNPETSIQQKIIKCVQDLDIKNIRVMRKIAQILEIIQDQLKDRHPKVIEQIATSLVLFIWCLYDSSENRPSSDFVRSWNRMTWVMRQDRVEPPPEETAWAQVLAQYGFSGMDDLDLALMKVVDRGYLEESGLLEAVQAHQQAAEAEEREHSFGRAWNMFHHTFAENEDELVQALDESFRQAAQNIAPNNLNSTVQLLRQLGRNEQADALIEEYVNQRGNQPNIFDLPNSPFGEMVTDPAIRARFEQANARNIAILDLPTAASYVAENNGWGNSQIAALRRADVGDYVEYFMTLGSSTGRIVRALLRFGQWPEYGDIAKKARDALVVIGQRSRLNAIRVEYFGVDVNGQH